MSVLKECIVRAILQEQCEKNRLFHSLCGSDYKAIEIDQNVTDFIIRFISLGQIKTKPKYLDEYCSINHGYVWDDIVNAIQQEIVPYRGALLDQIARLPVGTQINIPPITISRTPDDPFKLILTFLGTEPDLSPLRTVSKRFKRIADDPSTLLELLLFDEDPIPTDWKPYTNLKRLDLQQIDDYDGDAFFPKSLQELTINNVFGLDDKDIVLPNGLKSLSIRNTDIVFDILIIPKSVQTLVLNTDNPDVDARNLFRMDLSRVTRLVDLTVDTTALDLDKLPRRLERLTIFENVIVNADYTHNRRLHIHNRRVLPNLKEFKMVLPHEFDDISDGSSIIGITTTTLSNFNNDIRKIVLEIPYPLRNSSLIVEGDALNTINISNYRNLETLELGYIADRKIRLRKDQLGLIINEPELLIVD